MKTARRTLVITLGLLALSTAVALASGGEHHADSGKLLTDFLWRCLNFAVTLGLLLYFVTKPLKNGLKGRSETIAKELEEAQKAREAAEAKFAEYDEKLNTAEAEIEDITADLKREGEAERDKLIASAREQAEKIKREAEKSAALEVAKARAGLQKEAARLAVELAEELLKKNIERKDQDGLVAEYMKKVGELH